MTARARVAAAQAEAQTQDVALARGQLGHDQGQEGGRQGDDQHGQGLPAVLAQSRPAHRRTEWFGQGRGGVGGGEEPGHDRTDLHGAEEAGRLTGQPGHPGTAGTPRAQVGQQIGPGDFRLDPAPFLLPAVEPLGSAGSRKDQFDQGTVPHKDVALPRTGRLVQELIAYGRPEDRPRSYEIRLRA